MIGRKNATRAPSTLQTPSGRPASLSYRDCVRVTPLSPMVSHNQSYIRMAPPPAPAPQPPPPPASIHQTRPSYTSVTQHHPNHRQNSSSSEVYAYTPMSFHPLHTDASSLYHTSSSVLPAHHLTYPYHPSSQQLYHPIIAASCRGAAASFTSASAAQCHFSLSSPGTMFTALGGSPCLPTTPVYTFMPSANHFQFV